MPDVHAKTFAPSGAYKWLNCPGSVLLEANYPDTTSEYAKEGTLAHSIGELKLQKKFTVLSQRTYTTRLNKLKKDELYNPEMDGYTDAYLDYVTEVAMRFDSAPHVAIEKHVSFEKYAPGGFGTSDCIVIGGNHMCVIDLKYGKGVPVSAEGNPQALLYALGAYIAYSMLYPISKVTVAIVQPRLDNISEFDISVNNLLDWADDIVKPAVEKIQNSNAECVAGPWCDKGFCKARGKCRAQAKTYTALEDFGGAVSPELSDEEIGDILKRAESLKKWVTNLEEYALNACLDGKVIPGWKVVEGRQVRAFTDLEKAFETIEKSGIPREMLYENKAISLTAAEKLVGKKDFETLLDGYIAKKPGKPTLVPESDRREPYKVGASKDFEGVG